MTTGTGGRSGIVKYLGNLVDSTKDFVDDVLDRGHDVERDVRATARKAFKNDGETERDSIHEDLAALQASLVVLTKKVDELSVAQQRAFTESS